VGLDLYQGNNAGVAVIDSLPGGASISWTSLLAGCNNYDPAISTIILYEGYHYENNTKRI
jgi:hypothetical protein